MSIFSMVLRLMHLPHALNRGVHHLERSETSRRRPSIDVRLVYQVDVLGILATAAITGSCSFQVSVIMSLTRERAAFSRLLKTPPR